MYNNKVNTEWNIVDDTCDQLESGYYVKNKIEKNKIYLFKIEDILYVYFCIYVIFLLYILL